MESTMKAEELIRLRDEIGALLLGKVEGDIAAEHAAVTQAAKQLEQFGCMGGSTRAAAEGEIVRLMKRFDNTRDCGYGPWPVSQFMSERDQRADAFRTALAACVEAHRTGRYEPMVAAIAAAEALISEQPA